MPGTNYFSYFPSIEYSYPNSYDKTVVDIFKRAKMRNINDVCKTHTFYKYTIQDGEMPEHIAERYYGDSQYYWVILYANNIVNMIGQWPRSYREFETYIIGKYGSIEAAANILSEAAFHHYEDEDGDWVVGPIYTVLEDSVEVIKESKLVTIYDYEYELNEDKKEINIVKSEYLMQIIGEMNNIFRS